MRPVATALQRVRCAVQPCPPYLPASRARSWPRPCPARYRPPQTRSRPACAPLFRTCLQTTAACRASAPSPAVSPHSLHGQRVGAASVQGYGGCAGSSIWDRHCFKSQQFQSCFGITQFGIKCPYPCPRTTRRRPMNKSTPRGGGWRRSLFCIAVATCSQAASAQAVFKCQEGGQTVFKDHPCGGAQGTVAHAWSDALFLRLSISPRIRTPCTTPDIPMYSRCATG